MTWPLRRRWAVMCCSRLFLASGRWRELGRHWTYTGAATRLGALVTDPALGSGMVFTLVDLRDGFTMMEVAQVGTLDVLDPYDGGRRHQLKDTIDEEVAA